MSDQREHGGFMDRVQETAREIVGPGPESERDGPLVNEEGMRASGTTAHNAPDAEEAIDDTGMAIGMETIAYGTGPDESGAGRYSSVEEIEREAGL